MRPNSGSAFVLVHGRCGERRRIMVRHLRRIDPRQREFVLQLPGQLEIQLAMEPDEELEIPTLVMIGHEMALGAGQCEMKALSLHPSSGFN